MQEIPNNFTSNVGDEWEPQDSILLKKVIAMMEYGYGALRNFPKSEKYAMAADIKKCMDELMELVIEADNKHYKKNTLQQADTANKKLKKYLFVAYRLKFLPFRQYKNWSKDTAEIGRIIGGRISSAGTK